MWILVSVLLTLGVGIAIFWPYLRTQPSITGASKLDPRLAELYSQRDMLYQAIRDARFDMETGKLSPQDYEAQTAKLKVDAAEVLRAIDKLEAQLTSPELEAKVEAAIAQARALPGAVAEPNGKSLGHTKFCGQCGAALRPGDKFCAHCGQRVH